MVKLLSILNALDAKLVSTLAQSASMRIKDGKQFLQTKVNA